MTDYTTDSEKTVECKSGWKVNVCLVLSCLVLLLCLCWSFTTISKIRQEKALLESITLDEDGAYNSKEDVAAYIYKFRHLPPNYITKKEANIKGWIGGSITSLIPKAAIGGDRYYAQYGISAIPMAPGRYYRECDVNTWDKEDRGSERLLYSNDGMIFYTPDHYNNFEDISPARHKK